MIPTLKTVNLNLKTLNDVEVENLLTIATNQTVTANITLHRLYAQNIDTIWTNGISLRKSAVDMEKSTPIKGNNLLLVNPFQKILPSASNTNCFIVHIFFNCGELP